LSPATSNDKPDVLFTAEQIRKRISQIGAEIAREYAGQELCVVGLMKNCLVFMADLIRAIPVPMSCHMVKSTQGGRGGTEIVYSAEVPYEGRHILLLDDVVDTGITLSYLLDHIREHQPRSLKVCALIDRMQDRKVDVQPDWVVFSLREPLDRFLVGYGLDYAERYRELPYIGTLERPAPPTEGGKLNMSLESEK
jgi:hypoxanthine phosphoribosyltransferase